MVVAVDEAGKEDMAAKVQHDIRALRQLGGRADLLDHTVAGKEARILELAPPTVHRHQHVGILCKQRSHLVSNKSL